MSKQLLNDNGHDPGCWEKHLILEIEIMMFYLKIFQQEMNTKYTPCREIVLVLLPMRRCILFIIYVMGLSRQKEDSNICLLF